jgi:Zn finger protein HypA/HybF involved in hydrogenase expression
MHEFGLADDLLGAASAEAARAGGRPAKIGVRLGSSGVDPEALRVSFEALTAHRGLDVALVIETEPEVGECGCGEPLEVAGPLGMCPVCGALQTRQTGGPGLEISFVEVDADGDEPR